MQISGAIGSGPSHLAFISGRGTARYADTLVQRVRLHPVPPGAQRRKASTRTAQSAKAVTSRAVIGAGDSCYAVVRFTPTDFFAGHLQAGSLTATATATDQVTGVVTDELSIPVLGEGVL